jgi:hypothetical protein
VQQDMGALCISHDKRDIACDRRRPNMMWLRWSSSTAEKHSMTEAHARAERRTAQPGKSAQCSSW